MSIFGPEQIAAGARAVAKALTDEPTLAGKRMTPKQRSAWLTIVATDAAEAALDREAVEEKVMVALRAAPWGYGPHGLARLAVAALFPTEGGTDA